jgi:transposase
MRKAAPWLKTALVRCAWAAIRKKASYLQAQFHRLRARRGAKKAIGAVAASILTAAYHMLKNGTLYEDPGPDHFDKQAKRKQVHRLIDCLRNLGFAVQITPWRQQPNVRANLQPAQRPRRGVIDRQTAAWPAWSRRPVSF